MHGHRFEVIYDLHDTVDYLQAFQIVILTETQSMATQILPEYQRFEIPAGRSGAKGEGLSSTSTQLLHME